MVGKINIDMDTIQKGKWQIGMTKQYQGKTYVVSGFNAKGKELWKLQNKQQGGAQTQQPAAPKPKEDKKDDVKPTTKQATDNKQEEKKPSSDTKQQTKTTDKSAVADYGMPKPKVTYKNASAHPEAPFFVPKTFFVGGKQFHRDKVREVYGDKTKTPDKSLLIVINNKGKSGEGNNENFVQLALEEAAARGIPESQINIDENAKIRKQWKQLKYRYDLEHKKEKSDVPIEEQDTLDLSILEDMDIDKFLNKFNSGEDSYLNKEDDRVKKEFNNFTTLYDRQRFDAFTDYMHLQDPMYDGPRSQLFDLNGALLNFFEDRDPESVPIMISAGGAGAGKTTGMRIVADAANLEFFDPDKGHQPGDGNYDIYMAAKDINDDLDFRKLLTDHNGKIIVFDDKDKLLTTSASKLISMMKSLGDGDPKNRVFVDSSGNQQRFDGKILFITNKSWDTLNKNEDNKAVLSRAIKHDVHLTVNETLDILKDRYKTMGPSLKGIVTPQEEQDIRRELYDMMVFEKDTLDPAKFTPRKFVEGLEHIKTVLRKNSKLDKDPNFANVLGSKKDWRTNIRSIFNKAMQLDGDDSFEKAVELNEKNKGYFLKIYRKDPKKFVELFGEKTKERLFGDGDEEETVDFDEKVEKSIIDEFNVSHDEAMQILGL